MKKYNKFVSILFWLIFIAIIIFVCIKVFKAFDSSTEEIAKNNIKAYISALNDTIVIKDLDLDGEYTVEDLKVYVSSNKGPTSGTVIIRNKKVVDYSLKIWDYMATTKNGKIIIEKIK